MWKELPSRQQKSTPRAHEVPEILPAVTSRIGKSHNSWGIRQSIWKVLPQQWRGINTRLNALLFLPNTLLKQDWKGANHFQDLMTSQTKLKNICRYKKLSITQEGKIHSAWCLIIFTRHAKVQENTIYNEEEKQSLIIREQQIKTTISYHQTIKMSHSKMTHPTKSWQGCGVIEILMQYGSECKMQQTLKITLSVSQI